jgi:molecular chaperone GrpE
MTESVSNSEEIEVDDEVPEDVPTDEAGDGPQSSEPKRIPDAGVEAPADEDPEQADVAEDVPHETSELAALSERYDGLNDRHLRLAAEFNNFRRRSEQERLSVWSRAQADLVARFVDVLDDLQRVAELDLTNATVEAIMEGIDLVEKKFVRGLEDASVEMIDPAGQAFDPESMEAMMRVPAESEDMVDTVAQVFQKGYALKGVLVRPARVSVYTPS